MRSPAEMATIYLAVNSVNGKLYVGKTGREFLVRIREHEYDSRNKNRTVFSRAIRKYGIEQFTFKVVETCSLELMNARERYWISFYACRKPNGYNLTDGGDGALGAERPDISIINRAKVGSLNPAYGKIHTAEENKRNSEMLSGAGNPRFGKTWTPEQRRLISERTKAAMARPEVRERFIARFATPMSLETREKISKAHLAVQARKRGVAA